MPQPIRKTATEPASQIELVPDGPTYPAFETLPPTPPPFLKLALTPRSTVSIQLAKPAKQAVTRSFDKMAAAKAIAEEGAENIATVFNTVDAFTTWALLAADARFQQVKHLMTEEELAAHATRQTNFLTNQINVIQTFHDQILEIQEEARNLPNDPRFWNRDTAIDSIEGFLWGGIPGLERLGLKLSNAEKMKCFVLGPNYATKLEEDYWAGKRPESPR